MNSLPRSTDPMATERLASIVTAANAALSTGLGPLQEIHEWYQHILVEMDLLIDDLATAQEGAIRRILRHMDDK